MAEIRELIDQLNAATKAYDIGAPIISDKEWDNLYFSLQQQERETGIIYEDSPTQTISYEVVNELKKVTHNHQMLSLDKTKDINEVKSFLNTDKRYIAMLKLDGLTCSLHYKDGELIGAETRGNGIEGEDVLHNARIINSIPQKIPYDDELIVDGEIICLKNNFEDFSQEYKNPRNFAAGSIRLLDSKECEKRKLSFCAWDVIKGFDYLSLLSDKLSALHEKCGFWTVPYTFLPVEDSIVFLKNVAASCNIPIDGIVFKFDDIEYSKSLGQTSHHFKNAIAYKFYDETYSTNLIDIDWTMGRTGTLTPVAVFSPVSIDGSVISRANLHNLSVLEEILGTPYEGQPLEIYRSNMIIPQVKSATKLTNPSYEVNFLKHPQYCPFCGAELKIIQENDSKELVCDNPNCDAVLINRLDHFAGKKGLDIKGLSKATLEKLINQNWVTCATDIFYLKDHREDWIKLDGFGEKSVDKILRAIEDSKKCTLDSFISALGIPLIGKNVAKDLTKVFSNYDELRKAVDSHYNFTTIPNFGENKANSITNFNFEEADRIASLLTIENQNNINRSNKLEGLVFVITGKVHIFKNRDELKEKIESNGGKVSNSITRKTNYLINNDINSKSKKNEEAKSAEVRIISEEDFLKIFDL